MTVASAAPVRWGFLGAGQVATAALAPAVHDAAGAALQAVASRDRGRAAALGPARVSTSYREVCEADDVDVVYVALPNDAHLPWVLAALASGKHVLCEKPLGLDAGEVDAMRRAAAAADRLLVEATWSRWHPRTRRMLDLVEGFEGPLRVTSWFTFPLARDDGYRWHPEQGGGALLDVGPYAVGTALAALGRGRASEARVVSASSSWAPTGVDVTTTAVLAAGADEATVTVSFERPESQGFRVTAADASVELAAPAFTSWRDPAVLVVERGGERRHERVDAVDAYRCMVESVSARVRGEDAWVLPLSESHAVARVLDAIADAAADAATS